jgi:hypothetical protein
MGKEEEAYWFGQLATKLMQGNASIPPTTMVVHCYLSHLRLPVSASIEPYLSAYRVSLQTGDLVMGSICLCNYLWVYKFSGLPLKPFAEDFKKYLTELRLCHQDFLLAFLLPDYHFTLNLTGQTDHPNEVSWELIHRSNMFTYKTVVPAEHPAELNRLYTQIFNALILNDIDLVEEALLGVLARKKRFRRFEGTHISNQFFIFYDGLASFALLRKHLSRKFAKVARDSVRDLTLMSRRGTVNCTGMLGLLKAEELALFQSKKRSSVPHHATSWQDSAETGAVKKSYDTASANLSRSGFFHYSAYANERLGLFMLQNEDEFWAEHYLHRAILLYRDWGASLKVQRMTETHGFVHSGETEHDDGSSPMHHGYSIRAKARYHSMYDSVSNLVPEI